MHSLIVMQTAIANLGRLDLLWWRVDEFDDKASPLVAFLLSTTSLFLRSFAIQPSLNPAMFEAPVTV
jgi:hypothetical protein